MIVLATVLAAGCSDSAGLVSVSGVVKLDGKPLAGATVMFNPKAAGARPAIGVTGQDGVFRLTTFKSNDGAPRGEYQVTIQAGAETPLKKIDRQILEKGLSGQAPAESPSRIHANYTRINTTPIKQIVPPSGPIEFLLTSDGK
jgi:hypothetical protein